MQPSIRRLQLPDKAVTITNVRATVAKLKKGVMEGQTAINVVVT